ncbi:MAG: toll/interleukin-1 receptor domain-containing protein [Pseudomonadota bacterium]
MATIFISHANQDDALTGTLLDWLHQSGFTDTFVDHLDILGGANWTDTLRDQAAACRVVICVLTEHWLRSSECYNEFQAAWYMGKSILPVVLIDPSNPGEGEAGRRMARVLAETQGVDLRAVLNDANLLDFSRDYTVADLLARSLRAFGAQSQIGLDPTAFAIDQTAQPTPFPGLVSFGDGDADAAIFYGRSREIAEAVEELRSMRANADRRPLVILGVSGAGKSSVLKAGIVPRLRRETQAWLPLRVFRPGLDPLGSFADALSRTFADLGIPQPPGQIRADLERARASSEEAVINALDVIAKQLRRAAGAEGATILISIDQAEELLQTSQAPLGPFLSAALSGPRGWLVAFTIRTDRFPDLQSHPSFRDLKARGYDLRQLPPFRFSDVVEGPAARYGVALSPDLVDAFMDDAPEQDALPLLAFALQRLWDQFSASKVLKLEDYHAMGGMSGLISDAAERALAGLSPGETRPPSEVSAAQLALAESAFVPALVDINEAGIVTRRTALWSEFTAEERALLARFEAWRLVVRRGVDQEARVEVAHEALFREWPRMRAWLEPEINRIEVLRGVIDAARLWDLSGRKTVLLNHRGPRLSDAKALLSVPRYADRLSKIERAYLTRCGMLARRGRVYAALAACVVVGAIGLGVWSYLQSEQRLNAERELAFLERVATAEGAADISSLESFTQYILTDPYALTRDDRFSVLREILEGAEAAVGPRYAIAEYALDGVEAPEIALYELEYSAERPIDPTLFPVLWRPVAAALAQETGLPAPIQFTLVANPAYPPGRVVIRRGGTEVFDQFLPATETRHILDIGALDRADLKAFFDANKSAFAPAEAITGSPDHFYVPDWSVPLWNAGRDRNSNSRVLPPGADFALMLRNQIAESPLIVLDDQVLAQVLDLLPKRYDITVMEFQATHGSDTSDAILAWLAKGNALNNVLFGLAALGPPDRLQGPVIEGADLGLKGDSRRTTSSFDGPREKNSENKADTLMLADVSPFWSAEIDATLRQIKLRTAPIRVRVPVAPADTNDWGPLHRALYADTSFALAPGFLDAKAVAQAALFRSQGVISLDVEIYPDANLPPAHIAIDLVGTSGGATLLEPVAMTATTAMDVANEVLEAVSAAVADRPGQFVFAHDIAGYLDTASPARRSWALSNFAHADLASLVAGLIEAERLQPDRTASSLVDFDWLLGALVFSTALHETLDGEAHIALWADLTGAISSGPHGDAKSDIQTQIESGIASLIADDVAAAHATFVEAVSRDADAARAAFLSLYTDQATQMLFTRLSDACADPMEPELGSIEANQLALYLSSLESRMTAIATEDLQVFELCLLASQKDMAPERWLSEALAFAAHHDPEQMDPEHAGWLGRSLWQRYDPLKDSDAHLAVGKRFLVSGLARIDDSLTLDTIGYAMFEHCLPRVDINPCMRRVLDLAEITGRPALSLHVFETLAYSIYPEDRRQVSAQVDLYRAKFGADPAYFNDTTGFYRAYIPFLRGAVLYTDGKPGSDAWRRARDMLTEASEHPDIRIRALWAVTTLVTDAEGVEAGEQVIADTLEQVVIEDLSPWDRSILALIQFALAAEAGHGEDFLTEMENLTDATGCAGRFDGDCRIAWIWRAVAQIIYQHGDWQTVGRTVTSRVDHPYSVLVSLMLNAQGGRVSGALELMQRNWDRIDPSLWPRRIALEDERVWREILLGYGVGEIVEGYDPEALLTVFKDPEAFAAHPFAQIGLRREELLVEALFYTAMKEIAEGRDAVGIALLQETLAVEYWNALESSFAVPFLAQLEARAAE